jgi:ESCRT-I complex subunit TSG101
MHLTNARYFFNSNLYGQTRPTYPGGSGTPGGPVARPSYADDTIKPEHYRMSLISAIQDKFRMRFQDAMEEKTAEVDSLRRTNNDLEESNRQLNYLITEAEQEIINIDQMTEELKRKCTALTEQMNRQQLREKADIEDAVITPYPLYRQLLQLYAEETAIQDLIFYLGEGLAHQTVKLDDFLKQVRFLTRKQFFLRATMDLARQKAGLPT